LPLYLPVLTFASHHNFYQLVKGIAVLIRTDRTTGLQRGSGDTQAAMPRARGVGSAPFSAPPSPL